jgi:hypothetical protein
MVTNGGFFSYPDRVTTDIYYRKSEDRVTKPAVIKSGQVLKARSFVQSDSIGKMIAHTGLAETALVTFATITTGQTLILGGLTFTAGSGSVTAAQLVTIWSGIFNGMTAAQANAQILAAGINATTVGTFTSGTFTGWNTKAYDVFSKVEFTSVSALINVIDLGLSTTASITATASQPGQAVLLTASTTGAANGASIAGPGIPDGTTIVSFSTNVSITLSNNLTTAASTTAAAYTIYTAGMGTATAPTVTTVAGNASFSKIAGITLYDVDATAGDVSAEIWTEVSLWNDVIVWAVDTTVDTITKYDGTTVACTAYNTGTFGYDKASTELLRAKFVEATEFEPLGFLKLGEVSNG